MMPLLTPVSRSRSPTNEMPARLTGILVLARPAKMGLSVDEDGNLIIEEPAA